MVRWPTESVVRIAAYESQPMTRGNMLIANYWWSLTKISFSPQQQIRFHLEVWNPSFELKTQSGKLSKFNSIKILNVFILSSTQGSSRLFCYRSGLSGPNLLRRHEESHILYIGSSSNLVTLSHWSLPWKRLEHALRCILYKIRTKTKLKKQFCVCKKQFAIRKSFLLLKLPLSARMRLAKKVVKKCKKIPGKINTITARVSLLQPKFYRIFTRKFLPFKAFPVSNGGYM